MNSIELISFFERDLKKLITEIELYKKEENIWRVEKSISNSAGTLTLHIIGNLHAFIGKEIGKTGYVRNRELEFTKRNVPRRELIAGVRETIEMVNKSLISLTSEELKMDYPVLKFVKVETNEYLLFHLINHLTYHLGQINYHRRLMDV
ncbi:DinB family protein [Formosa sp. PL04]|uniref:DinB family protein n=1 Tax=Formosa sp. PL04 TaxID=3081755 RepID=UPI00298273C8|nr:DinB family protein [Formosa sp. PL04]MDW5290532.1 DinB family protein [Formosa sp. PL04]